MTRTETLLPLAAVGLLALAILPAPQPVSLPTPSAPWVPGDALVWTAYPPLRGSAGLSPGILDEVNAHVSNPAYWRSADVGNWTHEGTHGCHADLRQRHGRPGLYLGGDRAILLTHPPTTIRAVAACVPEAFRGMMYRTYCVSQAGQWDREPLYLWDEWAAYINGAKCGGGRRGTLSEYLPIGLAVGLAARLSGQEAEALAWLARETARECDRGHATLAELRTGAGGEAYRRLFRELYGGRLDLAGLLGS